MFRQACILAAFLSGLHDSTDKPGDPTDGPYKVIRVVVHPCRCVPRRASELSLPDLRSEVLEQANAPLRAASTQQSRCIFGEGIVCGKTILTEAPVCCADQFPASAAQLRLLLRCQNVPYHTTGGAFRSAFTMVPGCPSSRLAVPLPRRKAS